MNHTAASSKILHLEQNQCATIGEILVHLGKISYKEAENISRVQKEKKLLFGETAIYLGLVRDEEVKQALARQFHFDYPLVQQIDYDKDLIAAYEPFGNKMKQIRALRSQLLFRWFALGHRTLAVASVTPNEGTSFIAANLAVAYAQIEKRTLLIDANFASPRQHQIFKTPNTRGLSDILISRGGLEEATEAKHLNGLHVVSSGAIPPNPQELFSRTAFPNFCEQASTAFDVVIIDLSPLSLEAGAYEVAARANGILIIARKNQTNLANLRNFTHKLKSIGAQLAGFLLLDF
jgi:chain length determinant protein tyrosine kinase EpsG